MNRTRRRWRRYDSHIDQTGEYGNTFIKSQSKSVNKEKIKQERDRYLGSESERGMAKQVQCVQFREKRGATMERVVGA